MLIKYESLASPERHISRFETIAYLFGIDSKSAKISNVLEIACGTGRNLIPQAVQYPNANFLGIDIDEEAIKIANENSQKLALKNIRFKAISILDFVGEKEEFDYIICHGTYSWVSKEIRLKILDIISHTLKTNGVSYISYNCLPGWFERSKIQQELIQKLENKKKSDKEKIELAKNIMQEMLSSAESKDLKTELEYCNKQSDPFILNELLNKDSIAFHFLQFKKEVNKNNLFFLFDSKPSRNRYIRLEETAQLNIDYENKDINSFSRPEKEQHMDELMPTSFRGVLLTKENKETEEINIKKFENCFLASPLLPKEEKIELFKDFPELFLGPNDSSAEITKPFFKGFFLSFRHAWPNFLAFDEIYKMAKDLSGEEIAKEEVFSEINQFFLYGLMEVSKEQIIFPEKKLEVFKHVSLFAKESNWVTTVRHEYFPIDEIDKFLLTCLDGKNSMEEILELLYQHIEPSVVNEDKKEVNKLLDEQLKEKLRHYREQALIRIY